MIRNSFSSTSKMLVWMIVICICMLPAAIGLAEYPDNDAYTLYAVTAGKADALLLKAGDQAFMIDAGFTRSRGKILYAMEQLGIQSLNGVFITHTDNDHTDGLEWLSQSDIPIDRWYAPAMYTGLKKGKHPAENAASERGQQVTWLQAGDRIEIGSAVLDVLAPGIRFDDKDDNNSLVLKLRTPYGDMLLCGDMEYPEEEWLLSSGADVKCDVLKIPNHADNDVCSPEFIRAAAPSVAVISTSTEEKPETPDPILMDMLERNSIRVLQTQDVTGGVCVSLTSEGIRCFGVDLPEPSVGIQITGIDPASDVITIKNTSSEPADLSGWYMIPDKKNTFFIFPDQTLLSPGQQISIGSISADENVDFTWNEKKVINKKKTDGVTLYDRMGNTVSYAQNGI